MQAVSAIDRPTTAHLAFREREQDALQRRTSSPFRNHGESQGPSAADPWTDGDRDPWRQSGAPVELEYDRSSVATLGNTRIEDLLGDSEEIFEKDHTGRSSGMESLKKPQSKKVNSKAKPEAKKNAKAKAKAKESAGGMEGISEDLALLSGGGGGAVRSE